MPQLLQMAALDGRLKIPKDLKESPCLLRDINGVTKIYAGIDFLTFAEPRNVVMPAHVPASVCKSVCVNE